jgi:Zn-dependent peptidase ImmA (M78 family)
MKTFAGLPAAQRAAARERALPRRIDDALRSPGQPLQGPVRSFMEGRFDYDFSRVRVHTDAGAAESAHRLAARAYTSGSHIVFAEGQYAPETSAGRGLLGHELAHVVQQGSAAAPSPEAGAGERSAAEREAEAIAQRVAAGLAAPAPAVRAGPGVYLAPAAAAPARPPLELIDSRAKVITDSNEEAKRAGDQRRFEALREDVRRIIATVNEVVRVSSALSSVQRFVGIPSSPGSVELGSQNPLVQEVLSALESLAADLDAGAGVLRVHFRDALGGNVAAQYDTVEDIIELRRFDPADARRIRQTAIALLHEYVHALQDRAEEQQLLAAPGQQRRETRVEAEGREFEAFRKEGLLQLLLRGSPDGGVGEGSSLEQRSARAFEAQRTGAPAASKMLSEVRETIRSGYSGFYDVQLPSVQYAVEVAPDGKAAVLGPGSAKTPLVELGGSLNRSALNREIKQALVALPDLPRFAEAPGAERPKTLIFSVIYNGAIFSEIALRDPLVAEVDLGTGNSAALYDSSQTYHKLTGEIPAGGPARDQAIRQAVRESGVFARYRPEDRSKVRLVLTQGDAKIGEISLEE